MNVFIVLLTILVMINLFMIGVIIWATRRCKNKNSYIGGMILLLTLIANTMAVAGGLFL